MKLRSTILLCLLMLFGVFSYAQVMEPFSVRFSQNLEGDFTIIGNNMLSRTATGNYTGGNDNHNFNDNVYVDIDADPTTFNSSSANFTNPVLSVPCIEIFRAYLYWAAADTETITGGDNQPSWNFNDVKLMLPGEATYTTYTADDVIFRGRNTHFSNDPYICVKDITPQVMALANKYGTYQVANVEAAEGQLSHSNVGTSGGWQIVFIYESPDLPSRNITLFDGYAHVTASVNNFDVVFSGFNASPVGNVNANVVIGVLEGDRNLTGDRLQIQNVANNFVDITAPLRPANNFFNSRITVGNANYLNRNPASTNTLGYDAAVFQLDNPGNSIIANNQTSATLRMTSNLEVYGLYLLGLAVEIYQPSLRPLIITQTSGTNPTNPGDILGFNFNIENTGNDNARNVQISTTLPPQVELLPINPVPNGVTYTYNPATNFLQFNIADGFLDVGDPPINIDWEIQVRDQCYFLETNCDLDFDLQFTATYIGEQNAQQVITPSTADPSLCFAVPYTVNINQPSVGWLTPPGDLDVNLSCDDTAGLNAAQNLEPVPDACTFVLNKTSGPFVQGSCPNEGTYTNTWNFTDACGVTIADYVQVITIFDNEDPTASNPPPINVQCISDVPAPNVAVVTDEADNCSTPTVAFVSDISDNQSCPETITRTYSVTDACGNSINVTQDIIINDDILPTASDPAPINIQCISELPAPDPEVVTDEADNCSIPTVAFVSEGYSIQSCPETITRIYSVTDDCGNSITVSQQIIINDDILPTASDPSPILVQCISEVPDPDPEVVLDEADNCSVALVEFVSDVSDNQTCPETITRTYRVIDGCGNSITVSQAIIINDDILPTASNPSPLLVTCISLVPAPDVAVVTDEADNCSIPTVAFVSDVSDNQTCPETITRTYSVTDDCGNSINVTQEIIVNDDVLPSASNPETITVECIFDVPDPDISVVIDATDNCSVPTVEFVSDVSDNLSCPETITRTYSVTDECGNSIEVQQSILIHDETPPELVSQLVTEINLECEDLPSVPDLVFSDNCGGDISVEFDEVIANVNGIDYDIVRTWAATDMCGNTAAYTQTIYVRPLDIQDEISFEMCIYDGGVNLEDLITNTNDLSGEWESETIEFLNNGIFNPANISVGSYQFIYTVWENDCSWSTIVNIAVNDRCVEIPCVSTANEIIISKLVTPNGDGINDNFVVKFLLDERGQNSCNVSIDVSIYNRWGVKVFESTNYTNDWNGQAEKGVGGSGLLPTGTYYYIVTLRNSGLNPIDGFILLGTDY